jgi:hypothetical protein
MGIPEVLFARIAEEAGLLSSNVVFQDGKAWMAQTYDGRVECCKGNEPRDEINFGEKIESLEEGCGYLCFVVLMLGKSPSKGTLTSSLKKAVIEDKRPMIAPEISVFRDNIPSLSQLVAIMHDLI